MSDAAVRPREVARVLIVDDDDAVRRAAVRQLTSLGYGVIESASGADALSILARDIGIDVLLVDMSMPGLSGPEVARRAIEQRPTLRVLFVSGQYDAAAGNATFIVKPYRKQDLARKLEEVLRSAS